jgi:exonuclease III
MKILSYNVNGIRAAMRKDILPWLQTTDADVVCIQETKATKEQVDLEAIQAAGYPYHYWFSAQKKVIVVWLFSASKNLPMLPMERALSLWILRVETLE